MRLKMMVLLLALLFVPACVSPAATSAVRDGIAVNTGHMRDTGLPQQARDIAQDNYDLLNSVLYNLDGTPLPADTEARRAARAGATTAPVTTVTGEGGR